MVWKFKLSLFLGDKFVNGTLFQEELSAKLLDFLESPHATTDVLLAEKEKVYYFWIII